MDCRRTQEWMPLFVEGDLDSHRKDLVLDHLKCCVRCRHLASEFENSQGWLKSYVPPELDAAFLERIGQAVWAGIGEAGTPSVWERIIVWFRSVQLPVAVGALMVLIATGTFVLLRSGAKIGLPNTAAVTQDNPDKDPVARNTSLAREDRAPGSTTLVPRRVRSTSRSTTRGGGKVGATGPRAAEIAQAGEPSVQISTWPERSGVSGDSKEPDQLRIYIQTNDPNIRIIWLVPKADDGD